MSHKIRPGLSRCSSLAVSPMRAAAPGARFCTKTSAVLSRVLRALSASACFKSRVRLSLERFTQTKCEAKPETRSSYALAKSPAPGRSTLMTRAPKSASWRVQKGAAIACSSETTVMPSSGRTADLLLILKRPGKAEYVFGDIGINQIRGDGSHLIEARFTKLTLDIVFTGKAKTTVGL